LEKVKPEGNTAKQRLLPTTIDLLWQNSYGSVSVDDICTRAAVNKGSFYYAFKTKAELAAAAFDAHWNKRRPFLDAVFSAQNDPVERFDRYCDLVRRDQLDGYAQTGKILGCPYCSVGSEISTQDETIRRKVQELAERTMRYFGMALRDAVAQGKLPASTDVEALGRQLFCYVSGVLLQAKIANDPDVLNGLKPGVFRLLELPLPAGAPKT
jgi:TetR/AcrR family transcriptional repressor of nem operon